MNLGGGLKLETQILNGKTKLILAPYDVQEKTSKQVGNKGKVQRTALKVKHQQQVLHTAQNNHEKNEQPFPKFKSGGKVGVGSGRPPTNVLKELENKKHVPLLQQNVQQTKVDAGKTKPVPKMFSNVPKQRPQHKPVITAEDLRENLVCLTQEQFQQILMTINQSGKPNSQEQTADKDKQETEEESITPVLDAEEDANPVVADTADSLSTNLPKDVQTGTLFSTLGERERDKSLQEAKKAQWKRELDEQVALKKKLKEADQEGINFKPCDGLESSVSEITPYSDLSKNTPLNDYSTPHSLINTSPGTETTDFSPVERTSSFSSPELPAAIRSAFVLGEAAPLDHPFSAVKRQQQKKWLEELNKQREEVALRKIQEKQKIQEAEQQDLWAMHFDSFKKLADNQTPVYQNTANFQLSENSSSEPGQAEHQSAPAKSNLQQEQSGSRMSSEEENVYSQKAGFLRTMTALLDPAQIEERDRKRQKQLEHQKAIAAQVEEKRKRKQLEDEQRQREEQEEELRLAREREQLQKQYEEDALRQKQKEEILSLKTRDLYQSMQKAQEEAQRLKQEQRRRHLLGKGHDLLNLQKNSAGDAVHLDLSRVVRHTTDVLVEGTQSEANSIMKPSVTSLISPRKDTAVQTDDLDIGIKLESVSNGLFWRQEHNASPEIPVEFTYQQSKAEQPGKRVKCQRHRNESTKENTMNDLYDQYARTEKQPREPGQKPDWNRNRPQKKYVPASERYPKGLQKQREENKVRRQMELLHLVEKNSNNLNAKKGNSPERSPVREEAKISHPPDEIRLALEGRKDEKLQQVDAYFKRSDSPPVPAVRNRLHQPQRRANITPVPIVYSGNPISTQMNLSPELDKQETHRPSSSQFVPYVRTKEIYYLDPDAPMSRPSTHDPQYKRTAGEQESRQIFSSGHVRDPLLNPNVVRNKDRQQAILKGLSELRKVLLQKQRELETGLMPDV